MLTHPVTPSQSLSATILNLAISNHPVYRHAVQNIWWSSDGKNCQSECDHCDAMLHGWDTSMVHYGPVNSGGCGRSEYIRAQLLLISPHSSPGPAQKRKRLARAVCPWVPINVHSAAEGEQNLTMRCNYQIWHPSPCTVLPLHAITSPVLYCT